MSNPQNKPPMVTKQDKVVVADYVELSKIILNQ